MTITLSNAGKRFNRDWVFKAFDYTFLQGQAYAVIGNNGSGKSTLIQSISGILALNEGQCLWEDASISASPLSIEKIYKHFAIASPALELIEEMTAKEFLHFHSAFKPLLPQFSIEEILDFVQLNSAANKQIRFYSSGMKQRVKLAQAIFTKASVLFLDEPCTNFDKAGYELYHRLIQDFCQEKLIIVSSNDEPEYDFCSAVIDIRNYKSIG